MITAMPGSKLLIKNIIGSFMILIITILSISILLIPNIMELFKSGFSSPVASATALAGVLTVSFLFITSASWFIQSIIDYRNARDLDRLGLMTKGAIIEKWEEELNGKSVYHLQYKYLTHLSATQITDKDTYQQLQYYENVFVLYLDNLPHISRLDLD